jgi:hypothetical protein
MTARHLAAWTSAVLAIGSVLVSAITVMPEAESGRSTLLMVVVSLAGVFAATGIVLWLLPEDHWCNRSRTVRGILSIVATVATLLVLAIL